MCNSHSLNLDRFDNTRAEAFAFKMMNLLNTGSLALMISIGHRTGLFDTMASLEPSTSQAIAEAANLNERYVREWLGAMVAGEFVTYNPDTKHYALPREHAAFLTRQAAPDNIAVTTQYFAIMGGVENQIVECFKNGGGVPYSEFHRFHEVMAEESNQTTVSGLFTGILPLVPGLTDRLNAGISVVDVGCGRGRALTEMAARFPKSSFVGYDLSTDAVAEASAAAVSGGLSNIRFAALDLTNWSETDAYDLVTAFDAIHDQGHPDRVLANIRQALKSDGVFLMQDIAASSEVHKNVDHPLGPFIYTISCLHCMTVSLAQGGAGLGAAWGEELATKMLAEAGFGRVSVTQLDHDVQNNYYLAFPDAQSDGNKGATSRRVA